MLANTSDDARLWTLRPEALGQDAYVILMPPVAADSLLHTSTMTLRMGHHIREVEHNVFNLLVCTSTGAWYGSGGHSLL